MKKILIRSVVLVLVFAAAVFGMSKFLGKKSANTTEVMAQATFPLIYVNLNGKQMNCLHGYAQEMDVTAMRDTLTPIGDDKTVSIQIEPFENQISGVSFEVLTADGSKSQENTMVTSLGKTDEYVTADLTVQNRMLINTEYIMKIKVTAGTRSIYYYTRIIHQTNLNAEKYLDFATGFYERCLKGNDEDGLISQTIEPNEEGDNTTLAHMDIHSSGAQLMWGKLSPQIYLKPIPGIKELNENTATLELDYVITTQGETEEETEMYHVTEYYRMRYAQSQVMLLDFERDTNEIFNPENSVLVTNGIRLGINSRDITYKCDPQKKYFAFAQEGALWLYETETSKLTQVFSFLQNGKLDARSIYDENNIRIVNVDENGNMTFLLCGYMNRGQHEGECGVAVYTYNPATTSITECLYVETQEAFSLLDKDVETLAYMSRDKTHFYMMLEGSLYDINIAENTVTETISDRNSGCYAGSSTGGKFAWMEENEKYDSSVLMLRDLESGEDISFTCDSDEKLRPIGFIDEDLVYGVAKNSDIDTEDKGSEVFPMYKVLIVDSSGEVLKQYEPSDCYVIGGTIDEKLLTLERVKKTEGGYIETTSDNIVSSSADEEATYGFAVQNTERKQTETILKTGETIKEGTEPQVLYAKQVKSESDVTGEVAIEAKERTEDIYYVYAKGHLDSMHTSISEAVQRADEQLGVVVNRKQQLIWERGNKKTECKLDISTFPDVILKGKMNLKKLAKNLDQQVLDLTGCTLDSVLYYVSEGTPVLAKTPDGVVIISGYDQYNTILLKPGEAETYYYGLEESADLFEKAGNQFITYFDPIEE